MSFLQIITVASEEECIKILPKNLNDLNIVKYVRKTSYYYSQHRKHNVDNKVIIIMVILIIVNYKY